ncbi:MAG: hypothetical protein AMXMBFR34_51100 [Myxococcaceae bacterium]
MSPLDGASLPLLALAILAAAPAEPNLLALESGVVFTETPANDGGSWSPESLLDDSPAQGWCSATGSTGPWAFVVELEQRSLLALVEVDSTW